MKSRVHTDELIMTLVELALTSPEDKRQACVRSLCGTDSELFDEVWHYVQWEERMKGFLLDPLHPATESDHPFERGQLLINRFRIIREVAQGGMGVVWEAMDERLERRVALKCAKAGFGKQLPPEVRNAREIAHPNVCKIFEIHTASTPHGEIDFISMEFLEGETLAVHLRGAPIAEREARNIARQLCAGLAEAHRNHLIHGDLKANNVILTTDAEQSLRAVITDFGLARTAGASGAILGGTPAYMAPELWKGEKPSVASDIYALGVMLWELHSGRPPCDLGMTSSTLPLGEGISWKPPTGRGTWNRIVAGCLNPDPACRFQSATEVVAALGPSRVTKRFLTAAATVVLAAGSGVITYERAKPPVETVRLSILPFTSTPETASVSETLLRNTANQLSQLNGTPHTRFKFIPLDAVIRKRVTTPEEARVLMNATHTLRARVELRRESIVIRCFLTDLRSGVDVREWEAKYKPGTMPYAPVALAGVVTETVHLPPLARTARVNAAARKDYLSGLSCLHRDITVDAAVALMTKAVAADPDSPLTYAGLAEAQWSKYHGTNDKTWLNQASESARLAECRNPDVAEVHRIAGLLEWTTGAYESAIVEYVRAIELEPGNGDSYRRLGMAYESNNQFDKALATFRRAVEVQPRDFRIYQELGAFYFYRGEYGQAVKEFRKAVEMAPDEARPHFNLANVCVNLGLYNEAEREIREAIRLRETPDSLETLGLVLMYERREREAIRCLSRAASLSPNRYLTWLHLGICYRRINQTKEAARVNRRGLVAVEAEMTKNPRSGWMRSSLAYLSANLRQRPRAESEIAQALQLSQNNADVQFMAALTYEALHQRNQTLAVLSSSASVTIADVSRWPDVAALHQDPRFLELLTARGLR